MPPAKVGIGHFSGVGTISDWWWGLLFSFVILTTPYCPVMGFGTQLRPNFRKIGNILDGGMGIRTHDTFMKISGDRNSTTEPRGGLPYLGQGGRWQKIIGGAQCSDDVTMMSLLLY